MPWPTTPAFASRAGRDGCEYFAQLSLGEGGLKNPTSRCDHDIDECDSDPCQNGGTCINGLAEFTCHCDKDWEGDTCSELKYKHCGQEPCYHEGRCRNVTDKCESVLALPLCSGTEVSRRLQVERALREIRKVLI